MGVRGRAPDRPADYGTKTVLPKNPYANGTGRDISIVSDLGHDLVTDEDMPITYEDAAEEAADDGTGA
jgi:hypothetical protein